jgi:hypothetical protein
MRLAHFHCATSAVISHKWAFGLENTRYCSGHRSNGWDGKGSFGMSPGYFGLRDYLRTVQNKQSVACIISGLVRPRARLRTTLRRAVLDYPSLKRNTRNVPGMTIYGHYQHLYCHTCKWTYLVYTRGKCSISFAPTSAPPRAPVARAFLDETRSSDLYWINFADVAFAWSPMHRCGGD